MGEQLPSFSIIVPTYRRPRQVMTCLDALAGLDYPPESFEVILVDSSPSAAPEPLETFRNRLRLTVLQQPPRGPGAARNLGAETARGEFLAFTDDDCRPVPGWLRSFAAQFAITPDRAVGGPVLNALTDDPYASVTQLVIDSLYNWYNRVPDMPGYFGTNNLAVPARQFKSVCGFDDSFRLAGEDREFCARWQDHGYRMASVPEAIVWHAHALTLSSFWQQHFGYGRGSFLFRIRKIRGRRMAFALESPRFYWRMVAALFSHSRRSRHSALLLGSLLMVSQVANAAGFARQAFLVLKSRMNERTHHP